MGINLDAGAHPGPMGNFSPHAPSGSRYPPLSRVVVGSGGAPTGGRCPVFSTTALQDLGLQLQRHPAQTYLVLG